MAIKKNDGNTKTPYQNFKAVSFDFWGAPIGKNPDGTLYCPGFHMQGDKPGTTANAYLKDAYSTVLIGLEGPLQKNRQAQTPGKATLSIKKGRSLDMKKPAGSDGERATFHGLNCGRVEIAILIWTPQQLQQLRLLWNDLQPPANKADPAAYQVSHPELKSQGINALQFYDIEGPQPGPVARSMVYVLRSVEFLPPGKKKRTKTDEKALPTAIDAKPPATPGKNSKNTGPS